MPLAGIHLRNWIRYVSLKNPFACIYFDSHSIMSDTGENVALTRSVLATILKRMIGIRSSKRRSHPIIRNHGIRMGKFDDYWLS
jgi:hypothetical protein